MITGRSLGPQRQQLQLVGLLIEFVDVAPNAGIASFLDVDVDGVAGKAESLAAGVIGAVRVEHVEHAGHDRLQLLERRHHLGSADLDLDVAAADLLDVLLEQQGVSIRGLVVRPPARQQLDGLGARRPGP